MNTEQQSRLFSKGFEAGHKSGYKKALADVTEHIDMCLADTVETEGEAGILLEISCFLSKLKECKA